MHVSPAPAVGIVLEVEVPLAVVEDHSVRVVVPPESLRETKLRPQRLVVDVIHRGDVVRAHDERGAFLGGLAQSNRRLLTPVLPHVEKRPEVGFSLRPCDLGSELPDGLAAHDDVDPR